MAKNISCANSGDGELLINNFVQISIDPILLNNFSNEEGISAYFNSYSASEEFQALTNELVKEIMTIINENLTSTQRDVIIMTYIQGKTQNEISSKLGRHQTAVHKTLKGNIDYSNNAKRYGGAIKKIRKLCSKNEKIQKILKQMREKHEEIFYFGGKF